MKLLDRTEAPEQLTQRVAACLHRGGEALDPDRADRGARIRDVGDRRARRRLGRHVGRARDLVCAGKSSLQGVHRRGRLQAIDQNRARPLRRGQHLDRHLVHERERAVGAREQLADIVAGHVLDHPAAGLEALAPPAHRVHAEEVIARSACLDPARAREVARASAPPNVAPLVVPNSGA